MSNIARSELLEIAAGATEIFTNNWQMVQITGIVKLWFGTDTDSVISTKGFNLTDGSTIEPFDEMNGPISVYSVAGATLHIVR
jgi:hypothetical protein